MNVLAVLFASDARPPSDSFRRSMLSATLQLQIVQLGDHPSVMRFGRQARTWPLDVLEATFSELWAAQVADGRPDSQMQLAIKHIAIRSRDISFTEAEVQVCCTLLSCHARGCLAGKLERACPT